jgi:hypothetical protein
MMTFTILSTIIGAMLGRHFKVIVLPPVILFISASVIGIGIRNGDPVGLIILTCILIAACLQLGYLAGAIFASRVARFASYRHT